MLRLLSLRLLLLWCALVLSAVRASTMSACSCHLCVDAMQPACKASCHAQVVALAHHATVPIVFL